MSTSYDSVFISWASPDREAADMLELRLRAAGLDVFFSPRSMEGGQDPYEAVPAAVQEATVAVFFLSDEAVGREWIQREIHQAHGFLNDRHSPLTRLVPVAVGDLADESVPDEFRDTHRLPFDVTDRRTRERDILALVEELKRILGERLPRVIPSAMLAMTRGQFDELLAGDDTAGGPEAVEKIAAMCDALLLNGAQDRRRLIEQNFADRYDQRPADFRPFRGGDPLVAVINKALEGINEKRLSRNERPIHLRWDEELLLGKQPPFPDWLVAERASLGCLTIVDSLSALHRTIQDTIYQMPGPSTDVRHGIVWVPPYFPNPSAIEAATRSMAEVVTPLQKAFMEWSRPTERWIAFDTSNANSFRQWLARAVDSLAADPESLDELVDSVNEEYAEVGLNPRNFHKGRR